MMLNISQQYRQRQQSSIDKPLVGVVIPSKTTQENKMMLENCIASLRISDPNISFNIVVVESEKTVIECGQDKTVLYDQSDFCYNHALNQGLSEIDSLWVILANNDLFFKRGFMQEIFLAHAMNPHIQSFSPWNSMWSWHERVYANPPPIIEGYGIGRELCGWCIIARTAIFNTIDLSEEVYFWYSDNVYADALQEAGIRHALVTSSKVDHIVSQTKQVTQEEASASYGEYLRFKKGETDE